MAQEGASKGRILVVDDAAFIRKMIRELLTPLGYEIVGEAENGEKAVELYKQLKPDLVTMDITMKGLGGLEAAKRIKQIDPNAKIIMVTAMGQEDYVREAVKIGVKDFVVKPFSKERFLEAVEKALKG